MQGSTSEDFDPLLQLDKDLGNEFVEHMKKQEIRNILKSYTGLNDLFSELLQNALDAVDERRKEEEESYKPRVWIHINLKDQTICITDNGIGFTEEKFKHCLAPNVTFKSGKSLRGSKGVGTTYLAYGFNFLQMGTKTPSFTFVGNIEHGREWIEDDTDTVLRPKVRKGELIHEVFKKIDRGSTFSVKLVGPFIRPRDLSWIGAQNAKQWEIFLRVMSPLGGIYSEGNIPPTSCQLTVTNADGNVTSKEIQKCEYAYPHTLITSCVNLQDIINETEKLKKKLKPPSELPAKFKNLNGIYYRWGKDELLSEQFSHINQVTEFKNLVEKHNVRIYGFSCYTVNIWDQLNDDTLGLRKGYRVLAGGLRIAANSMVQGVNIQIPLKRYIWYQQTTHAIVHFDGVEPDLGRKGFQPEYQRLSEEISVNVANILREWSFVLKKETGVVPKISEDLELHEWRQNAIQHAKECPISIKGAGLFMPTEEIPIISEPLVEQDVVALFHQMLAAGLVRGLKIISTSEHEKYDGLFEIDMRKPFDKYIFNKENNPLGISENNFASGKVVSPPYVLEYKYSVDGLIEEIEKEDKHEGDIKLVIAWKMGDSWKTRYRIVPLLHCDHVHHRYIHGATHHIHNASTGALAFPAIIISELIRFLNDSDAEQEIQKKNYMED